MKIAIIGSRKLTVSEDELKDHVGECEEIVSGGAVGVDFSAKEFALKQGIKITEFFPKYEVYGRAAPIIRNKEIVDYSDRIIAFWDGNSKGTLSVIKYAQKQGKPCKIVIKRN